MENRHTPWVERSIPPFDHSASIASATAACYARSVSASFQLLPRSAMAMGNHRTSTTNEKLLVVGSCNSPACCYHTDAGSFADACLQYDSLAVTRGRTDNRRRLLRKSMTVDRQWTRKVDSYREDKTKERDRFDTPVTNNSPDKMSQGWDLNCRSF